MAIKVTNEGELEMLKLVLADSANWQVKLYKNDHFPADDDHLADYQEAVFEGYDGTQAPTGWSAPTTNGAGQAQTTANPIQFQHTAGTTACPIYGYYVISKVTNKVLWAEDLSTMSPPPPSRPVTLAALGDTITITPTLLLASMF
jgi:hypothetical protein